MNFNKQFRKKKQYRNSVYIAISLLVTGFLVQYFGGAIPKVWFSFPNNLIVGLIFIVLVTLLFLLYKKEEFINLLSSVPFAIVTSVVLGILTIGLGSINIDLGAENTSPLLIRLGFDNITTTWYFALVFLMLLTNLWLVILKRALVFQKKNITFLLNHFGLWLTLFAGVLGQGDLIRLHMTLHKDMPEWRATDAYGNTVELPIALELKEFNLDIYPNKVYIIDRDGNPLPHDKPESFLLENDGSSQRILDWTITLHQYISNAIPIGEGSYASNPMWGATNAAHITIENNKTKEKETQWIAAGNFQFPPVTHMLDSNYVLVMAPAEAKKFESEILVFQKGKEEVREAFIQVNHPEKVDGWKVYQTSYDERLGRWSEISVVELVMDPWLPLVYTGIFILIAGSAAFLIKNRK